MIGMKFEDRGQRAEAGRIRHARDRADHAGDDADADIDHRHHQQIVAEMLLDLVEDPQRPQPRRAVAEIHDHGPAQLAPARDEQDQRCDEQQEFGEGRRQEFQRRLHPVDLRQMERRQRVGTAEHALQLLPKRERPVEHMHFFLQYGSQLRKLAAPFHDGRGDQADREDSPGACRRHDQDGRDRARNPIALQEARRRRQHGADDEGHRNRQKEGPREIEPDDHDDDQQGDQRKGHDFRAADHRRQFALAVGDRRAFAPRSQAGVRRATVLSAEIWRPKAWWARAWRARAWWE